MPVKWVGLGLLLLPWVVNAKQPESLPDLELLEFLGRYSQEEQTWLEIAMQQEQDKLKKDQGRNATTGENTHE